jgi:hypothetical protein
VVPGVCHKRGRVYPLCVYLGIAEHGFL